VTTQRYIQWLLKHGRIIWLVALALALPAGWRTVKLYMNLKSDIEELLPRDAPSVRALDELRARTPGLQYLGVVVDTGTAENLPAGETFLDELAAKIRTYPPELVREVRVGQSEERAFVEKHAALYVSLPDLAEIRRRIEARRDYEVAKATGGLLDEDAPAPPIDISDIEALYKDKLSSGNDAPTRFSNAEQKTTMLFVEVGGASGGAAKGRVLLDRVKADVAALGGPAKYAPGMRVGYASDVAVTVEETEALEADLSLSSLLVILAVSGVIIAYFRWWKSVLVLLPPLLLATVYAFGLSSAWPIGIDSVNSNTAFLGSIIVGNGINVGLILLARYREERLRGATVDDALVAGVKGAKLGTFAAAAAAGVSYASLVVTEFRGFRQFGYIGGIGMLASWITAFVLVPPLLKWVDRGPPKAVPPRAWLMNRVVAGVERFPRAIVGVATLLTLACALKVSRFDSSQLEYDFNKLRRVDTWENGEGYWGRRMDKLLGHYLTPTILLADSPEQARAIAVKVKADVDTGSLHDTVASVRTIDDVVPLDQPAKLAEVARIREALTPNIRSLIAEDRRKKLDELLGDANARPIGADDVPRTFLTGLREHDGTIGRAVLVYPRPGDALWRAASIHEFVRALREDAKAGGGVGRVAGPIPISSDILGSIGRDAPLASLTSFIGVVLVVIFSIRRPKIVLWVIGSLLVGVVWLAGVSMFMGVKINFSNFIAYPITFGIGVDYSVNVMSRYLQDGSRNVKGAVVATGGAVALCSMTTILGYSSLLLAKNRALYLFGLLAVLGEIACLTAALIVLPAALLLVARVFRGRQAEGSEGP